MTDETGQSPTETVSHAAALEKINQIRNSIIGTQTLNWSEHVYPLVAALADAGFEGMPYPEGRKYYGTLVERAVKAEDEVERLKSILNSPIVEPFVSAAVSEAKHQVYRWGEDHDAQKTAWDWFWTLGYLGGKAAQSALAGDWHKAKHHTVTAAAMLANWHAQIVAAEQLNTGLTPEEMKAQAARCGCRGSDRCSMRT
jgi:hypothetical protein